MEETAEPQNKLTSLLKNPSTNSHNHNRNLGDISNYDNQGGHCCFACCAWSCLLIFIFIVIFLFVGIGYLAFLKAGMPVVNVRSLNITKLQIDDNSQKMNVAASLGMRFSNRNEKLKLMYGPLAIVLTSEDVLLGKNKIAGFSQQPKNDTDLDMTMTLNHANVDKYAASDLKSDIEAYEMVFDVYVSGNIGVQVGSLHMINVPFLAYCHEINKMDVDFGRRPACDVGMFDFRPTPN